MNRKQRFAIILLVIAAVLLITSVLVEFTIASAKKSLGEGTYEPQGSGVGKVELEIISSGEVADGKG